MLQQKKEEKEIDGDKFVLLSLLPSFRNLNEDQKLIAKTEFMQIIRGVQLSGTQMGIPQTPVNYQSTSQWSNFQTPSTTTFKKPTNSGSRFFSLFPGSVVPYNTGMHTYRLDITNKVQSVSPEIL